MARMTKEEIVNRILVFKGAYEPDPIKQETMVKGLCEWLARKHGAKQPPEVFQEKMRDLYEFYHQKEVAIYCRTFTGKQLAHMLAYYGSETYAREAAMKAETVCLDDEYIGKIQEAFTGEKCDSHT